MLKENDFIAPQGMIRVISCDYTFKKRIEADCCSEEEARSLIHRIKQEKSTIAMFLLYDENGKNLMIITGSI